MKRGVSRRRERQVVAGLVAAASVAIGLGGVQSPAEAACPRESMECSPRPTSPSTTRPAPPTTAPWPAVNFNVPEALLGPVVFPTGERLYLPYVFETWRDDRVAALPKVCPTDEPHYQTYFVLESASSVASVSVQSTLKRVDTGATTSIAAVADPRYTGSSRVFTTELSGLAPGRYTVRTEARGTLTSGASFVKAGPAATSFEVSDCTPEYLGQLHRELTWVGTPHGTTITESRAAGTSFSLPMDLRTWRHGAYLHGTVTGLWVALDGADTSGPRRDVFVGRALTPEFFDFSLTMPAGQGRYTSATFTVEGIGPDGRPFTLSDTQPADIAWR